MSQTSQISQDNPSSTTQTVQNKTPDNQDALLRHIELYDKINEILEKVKYVDKRVEKSIYETSSDIVTNYFDPNENNAGLRIFGWVLIGMWYYLFRKFFKFLFIILKFLFYLFIFLLLFIPLMFIGLLFIIIILVFITIWMSSKSFLDALIQVINPMIPVPLTIWNLIAAIFNGIGSIARRFGGRFPRMPTVRNPNAYKIRKGVPSIYAIIDFVTKPLKEAAWKQMVKTLD
jgi:hypothetical protein